MSDSDESLNDWCFVEHRSKSEDLIENEAASQDLAIPSEMTEAEVIAKERAIEEFIADCCEAESNVVEVGAGGDTLVSSKENHNLSNSRLEPLQQKEISSSGSGDSIISSAALSAKGESSTNGISFTSESGYVAPPSTASFHNHPPLKKMHIGVDGVPVVSQIYVEPDSCARGAYITRHKKKNSSSSDISIIDEKVDVFVREFENPGMVKEPVVRRPSATPSFKTSSSSGTVTRARTSSGYISHSPSYRYHPVKRSKWNEMFSTLCDYFHTFVFYLWVCLIIFLVIISIYGYFIPPVHTALEDIHFNLMACLGEQHVETMKNSDKLLKPSSLCKNDSEQWMNVKNLLVSPMLLSKLSRAQEMLLVNESDNLFNLLKRDLTHVNVKLIIQHMEYYEVIPTVLGHRSISDEVTYTLKGMGEEELVDQMHQAVENLTLLNHYLHDHIERIVESQSSDGSGTSSDNRDAKNSTSILNALEEKVRDLVAQNEDLKLEISNLKSAQTVGNATSQDRDPGFDSSPKSFVEHSSVNMEDSSEKSVNIADQIRLLQNTLDDKFLNVKRLLEFMQTFRSEVKLLLPPLGEEQEDDDMWSWDKLKENMESFLREKRNDLKETVSNYKNIDVAETLNHYVQDSKKHAENTLKFVTHYVKVAQKKTKEMINEKIDVESTVNGVWNVWGSLQNKWSDIKNRFEDLTGTMSPKVKEEEEEILRSENDNCSNMPNPKDSCEDDIAGSHNWFLRRAALREDQRVLKFPLNWYLRREMYREKARKMQSKKYRKCGF